MYFTVCIICILFLSGKLRMILIPEEFRILLLNHHKRIAEYFEFSIYDGRTRCFSVQNT